MSETADLRRKAETCLRLAEAASSARANELFKRMAGEYRAQAEALERPMASPPLAPPARDMETEPVAPPQPVEALDEAGDVVEADDVIEPADLVEPDDIVSPCLAPMPEMTLPQNPQANSAQWLAELQALRNRL